MSAEPVGERVLPGPLSSQPAQIQSRKAGWAANSARRHV